MRIDLIQKIAIYGDDYVATHLNKHIKSENTLLTDWQKSLNFLFDHSFYQGRKDLISLEVKERAKNVLEGYIKEKNVNPESILNKENFP